VVYRAVYAARISQNPTACAVSGGRCRSTAA